MFYSRFDESAGVYDVFQDDLTRPVNADLPIPDLPAELNGIGVPATEAGRPLPSGVRHVGQSWSPRGLIVFPKSKGSLSGEIASDGNDVAYAVLSIGVAACLVWMLFRNNRRSW